MFLVIQKNPGVRDWHWRTVGDGDYFAGLCAVDDTAKIHRGGGEEEVGVMDLGMQLHHIFLWVSHVIYYKDLAKL